MSKLNPRQKKALAGVKMVEADEPLSPFWERQLALVQRKAGRDPAPDPRAVISKVANLIGDDSVLARAWTKFYSELGSQVYRRMDHSGIDPRELDLVNFLVDESDLEREMGDAITDLIKSTFGPKR